MALLNGKLAGNTTTCPAFIRPLNDKPVHLTLAKDLSRTLRSGHPWLFADAFQAIPNARPGSLALVKNKKGDILSKGFLDPAASLAYRSLATLKERLDDSLVAGRLERCLLLRQRLFPDPSITNGYRLINGEGDGLPGLVCDVYANVAVVKLDGAGPQGFYNEQVIADWLLGRLSPTGLTSVYLKHASGSTQGRGRLLAGSPLAAGRPLVFVENGVSFQVDVVAGQKTGFFLDQRDNRALLGSLCRPCAAFPSGPTVLNVFGYTGGFSVYAGRSGAAHVSTVDIATPAVEAAKANWALNGLPAQTHSGVVDDAFDFLEQAQTSGQSWDVVVVDPPSFAPSKQALDNALNSYESLFAQAAQVTKDGGLLALSSCSSHVTHQAFNEVCAAALNKARRRGFALVHAGQPADHPTPAAADELRYLKFNVYQLEA
ncbi:S-adenosyl-L-methionine-dependent methyltransferase [Haematococcus lacustris]